MRPTTKSRGPACRTGGVRLIVSVGSRFVFDGRGRRCAAVACRSENTLRVAQMAPAERVAEAVVAAFEGRLVTAGRAARGGGR